ncbi:MAG: hypothetical protein JWO20_3164 [Candidatus Angelobacter sp.]|jgi:hypothetical protein|nr:hypothetical protein [Candidatus Angelobacter sp.]
MRKLIAISIYVALWTNLGFAEKPKSLCSVSGLASQMPAESGIAATNLEFYASSEDSGARLVLSNRSQKPLNNIFLLMEFLGDGDRRIVSVPFFAAIPPYDTRFSLTTPHMTSTQMNKPLSPEEEVAVSGITGLTSAQCPTKVRVGAVEISFSDHTSFHYSAPEWELDPTIRKADPLKLQSVSNQFPLEAEVEVNLDSKGRITALNPHVTNKNLADLLQAQLASWLFNPKMKNGIKVDSQVVLLFRIHKIFDRQDGTLFDETALQRGPAIPVDVFLKPNSSTNEQLVLVAGLPIVSP